MTTLAEAALEVAIHYDGVRESRPNRGEYVDLFIRSVGIDPEEFEATHGKGPAWCAAFVYHCHARASALQQLANPCPKTAGALRMFTHAKANGYRVHEPQAGDVFFIDHGMGKGHTGFVVDADGPTIHTIEGNTNGAGSREGDGVHKRKRQVSSIAGFARFNPRGKNAP